MTRTTLKALWIGGGGVLATWLTVSPNSGSLRESRTPDHTTAHSEQKASELNAEAVQLRARTTAVMRPSTRNPFRFSTRKSESRPAAPVRSVQLTEQDPAPAPPSFPPLSLAGVAQDAGKRTAILTSGSQMYLAAEGETVAGTLTIIRIDPDSVVLRDASGAELRLQLPR